MNDIVCPRCGAIGEPVLGSDALYTVYWRHLGVAWQDMLVTPIDLADPEFGCGRDAMVQP